MNNRFLMSEDCPGGPAFEEVMSKRRLPGVLILDLKGKLLFLNKEASSLVSGEGNPAAKGLPLEEIGKLCAGKKGSDPTRASSVIHGGELFSLRAFPLKNARRKTPSHMMVIIEKCALGRAPKPGHEELRGKFNLTKREAEVIGEVIKGLTNREIARSLNLSEHTIKDYIKKIMGKLGVKCRTAIFCRVLESGRRGP